MLTALLLTTAAFAAPAVADAELAGMRGGFALPGGLEASMSVRSETSLNGGLLLRSVYSLDGGAPSLQLFAPRGGDTVRGPAAAPSATARAVANDMVRVSFDRQNGVSVAQRLPAPVTTVSVGVAAQAPPDDLPALDLSDGPVDTPGGRVSVEQMGQGLRARIAGDGLDASHLYGGAFGSVVTNTANDRSIDTATTVSINLSGATALNLGSGLLRAEAIGDDAVRQLVVR